MPGLLQEHHSELLFGRVDQFLATIQPEAGEDCDLHGRAAGYAERVVGTDRIRNLYTGIPRTAGAPAMSLAVPLMQ